MMWRKIGFLLIASGVIIGQGCGKPAAPRGIVRGHITFKQKPLMEYARVIFSNPEAGVTITASLASDGAYEIKTNKGSGLPPGNYQVAVIPRQIIPADQPMLITPAAGAASQPIKTVIPVRYHNVTTSKLTATVAVGENAPFDFDLLP
jgi:hypothetical protein